MKVDVFCVCDFAQVDSGGKLSLIGIFDKIHPPQLPFILSMFSVAGRMRFEGNEEGPKAFKLTFVGPDGEAFSDPVDIVIPVTRAQGDLYATAQIVLGLQQVRLWRAGEYRIELEIEHKPSGATSLLVNEPPVAPHLLRR